MEHILCFQKWKLMLMCSKMGGRKAKIKKKKKERVDLFPNFRYIHLSETVNGCWPCDRNQSLPTNLQERNRGREKNDTNAPYEKNRLDQRLVGREEGKPFHQVLEIQAAGS